MERIKQAIEKVTHQNLNEGGRMPHPQADYKTEPSVATNMQSSDVLEKVNYQQTRVVKLKADVLEKNRIFAFNKDDPASMIFDLLRTQVLQTME